jgi:Flp pilus assembly protein TadD
MSKLSKLMATVALSVGMVPLAWAGDVLKISIPRRSELTPVQKLNREGVEAIQKREYEKASSLFFKAYLYDPADPFTLNNLGYVSELEGQLDRAHKFYTLASEQGSNANIDRSNTKSLEGKPMQLALENLQDTPMRVNRMNVDAMNLLKDGRGFEAVALLEKAQGVDPRNPFTLNNLGVAEEEVGDFNSALRYYQDVVATRASDPVVVTVDKNFRGKSVSDMAAASARRLEDRIRNINTAETQAEMFAIRGVTATNANDWKTAREDFLHAFTLDPDNAFALNNRGFVAEMDGDMETAEFFYQKARRAGGSGGLVGLATAPGFDGKNLFTLAESSEHQVDRELERYSAERRRQTGPVELTPRENTAPAPQPQQ